MWQGLSGGLIDMDMFVGCDASFGVVEEIANARLDEHGLESGGCEQLIASEPGETVVGRRFLSRFS